MNAKEVIQQVVVNSLKDAAAQARTAERKAAKAYPNGFAREHICHLADAHGLAAKAYEDALAEYEQKLAAERAAQSIDVCPQCDEVHQ